MSGGGEAPGAGRLGPPPLRPFGLVLHHDGRWSHEGVPILHRRLREVFDRSVRFLPAEDRYVVQLGQFRGQIEVEEAAFFVRDFDAKTGRIGISDGSSERLDAATLRASPRDGALLCAVKQDLVSGGIDARFSHAAQSELLHAVEETPEGERLRVGGALLPLPGL